MCVIGGEGWLHGVWAKGVRGPEGHTVPLIDILLIARFFKLFNVSCMFISWYLSFLLILCTFHLFECVVIA